MKPWYSSGIRLALLFVGICFFINHLLSLFGIEVGLHIGIGLIMCSIWQLVLILTGHYK